jgi:hypothetical protein
MSLSFAEQYGILGSMERDRATDKLLPQIMVYGFALSFGLVAASMEALHRGPGGFSVRISWWTLLAFAVGAVAMVPCFHVIVFSERKPLRRAALTVVTVLGLGAFFYPLRMVPDEKFSGIFEGLAVAFFALSVLATLLFILYRFFEKETKLLE